MTIRRIGKSVLLAVLFASGCASTNKHSAEENLEILLKQNFSGVPVTQFESRLGLVDVPRTEISTGFRQTRLYHFDGFLLHVFYDFSSQTVWTGATGSDGPYTRHDGMTIAQRQTKIQEEERKVGGAAARGGSQQSAAPLPRAPQTGHSEGAH